MSEHLQTTSPRPTVHLVDDDASLRRGTARFVEAAGYLVKTYASAQEFLEASRNDGPGCVILDLRLPGSSGLDLQKAVAADLEPLPIIFLSGYGTVPESVRAMKDGALDFLTKPVDGETLLEAIGRAVAQDAETRSVRTRRSTLFQRYERLTTREREVFAHLISGQLNKQVGYDLGISERTVKLHRHQVLEKMAADSIAELVRLAAELEISSVGKVR
jgi:FixJ family two-component response regulator